MAVAKKPLGVPAKRMVEVVVVVVVGVVVMAVARLVT